jgi:DNA primase
MLFSFFPARGWPLVDDRAQIQQVKDASDIVDVVGAYVALRQVGQTFKGLCPFHQDTRPSFDVDPRRQRYRCWSCNKFGDVIQFVQEFERITFREALELLGKRAGISLEKKGANPQDRSRALMFELLAWAAEQFQCCLLDSPLAEAARRYVGERGLTGETVRRFGLGFAPPDGDWLVQRAAAKGLSDDLLEKVGLIARRDEGNGHYDRFRDRVMFPIRDTRGKTVGFGGRILPNSPKAAQAPKYYNSSETPLFSKSEQLYGLDQARQAGAAVGYLAVVEGYTDVLMAHQHGVCQVVATMGTALNARHVHHLRRFVPRVVLVFDADPGGNTGVDRALEIFASQDVELAIAMLPEGMDPCDLLVAQGSEPFKTALTNAVDALEFKLNQVLSSSDSQSIEGRRRAVDSVLRVIALAPEGAGQTGALKRELMVSRIAQRFALREETIWARLNELRAELESKRDRVADSLRESDARSQSERTAEEEKRAVPAAPEERELLQVLLAQPSLVATAAAQVGPQDILHPGLRQLLEGLYQLQAAGEIPDLDLLRSRIDNTRLMAHALKEQEIGRHSPEPAGWLQSILARFEQRRSLPQKQQLHDQLHGVNDHESAVELLKQLQKRNDS